MTREPRTPSSFGAEPDEEGVRFRLWAPAANRVDLVLEAAGPLGRRSTPLSMDPIGGGWFERLVAEARPGSLYRYRLDGAEARPDPASRFQPEGVHGPSQVVSARDHRWHNHGWHGRDWHETVIYELHVGAFTPEGTFTGVENRLDHLAGLGVTAVELMPVSAFAGERGWGYDGVFPFAPHRSYGTPASLRKLVDEAHGRGLMVFLDVVYNHFGPEGNHLPAYAPEFFSDRFATPWGPAIDFERREVRDFFIANALHWLEEYRFDGLRLDAVHAIRDDSSPDILEELSEVVQDRFRDRRQVHLVLENGNNEARYLERREDESPRHFVAQWNDDVHHAFHVVATGEVDGYYGAFREDPVRHLARCLAEGFTVRGDGRAGSGRHLPATAFVAYLQNHDQVGNRAFGERLSELVEPRVSEALTAILLLAPSPPLIFMGEEWAAPEPFLFFCDFRDELAESVREGRRREFARFEAFRGNRARYRIPDPNEEGTFLRSVLNWDRATSETHGSRLALSRRLLGIRRRELVPRLARLKGGMAEWRRLGRAGLQVRWRLGDHSILTLLANLADEVLRIEELAGGDVRLPRGRCLYQTPEGFKEDIEGGGLPAWSAAWFLHNP